MKGRKNKDTITIDMTPEELGRLNALLEVVVTGDVRPFGNMFNVKALAVDFRRELDPHGFEAPGETEKDQKENSDENPKR